MIVTLIRRMRILSFLSRGPAALALVASLTACDSSVAPDETLDAPLVSVSTPTETVTAGAIVDLRARNLSSTSWYYNVCSSPRLQRREGDAWVDAPDPLILCSAELETLSAGETVDIGVGIPVGSVAGTYRVRFRIARRDGVEAAPTTNTFQVQ